MGKHLKYLGFGVVIAWVVAISFFALVGISVENSFRLPTWGLAALLFPLPICWLIGVMFKPPDM